MRKSTATAALLAAFTISSHAATYALGENDAGAANGTALNASTTGSGAANLSLMGSSGTYSSSAAAGSTLAAEFTGSAAYGAAGQSFFSGIDQENFAFGFDAFPTGNPSFHIGMTVGSNAAADGAGGNVFIYLAGDQWFAHINNVGNIITAPAGSAVLNTWQNLRFERVAGVSMLYINGVAAGSTTTQFPAGGLKDALAIGGNRNTGGPGFEGGFVGRIDNAYFEAVPEPSAALLGAFAGLALLRRRRVS